VVDTIARRQVAEAGQREGTSVMMVSEPRDGRGHRFRLFDIRAVAAAR
jgi:hypothetical protein